MTPERIAVILSAFVATSILHGQAVDAEFSFTGNSSITGPAASIVRKPYELVFTQVLQCIGSFKITCSVGGSGEFIRVDMDPIFAAVIGSNTETSRYTISNSTNGAEITVKSLTSFQQGARFTIGRLWVEMPITTRATETELAIAIVSTECTQDQTVPVVKVTPFRITAVPDTQSTLFSRGDANQDGKQDITDAVFVLNYLFIGGEAPPCGTAANVDSNNIIQLTDAVYLLNFLFLGGKAPPPPYPDCGEANPEEASLSCGQSPFCAGANNGLKPVFMSNEHQFAIVSGATLQPNGSFAMEIHANSAISLCLSNRRLSEVEAILQDAFYVVRYAVKFDSAQEEIPIVFWGGNLSGTNQLWVSSERGGFSSNAVITVPSALHKLTLGPHVMHVKADLPKNNGAVVFEIDVDINVTNSRTPPNAQPPAPVPFPGMGEFFQAWASELLTAPNGATPLELRQLEIGNDGELNSGWYYHPAFTPWFDKLVASYGGLLAQPNAAARITGWHARIARWFRCYALVSCDNDEVENSNEEPFDINTVNTQACPQPDLCRIVDTEPCCELPECEHRPNDPNPDVAGKGLGCFLGRAYDITGSQMLREFFNPQDLNTVGFLRAMQLIHARGPYMHSKTIGPAPHLLRELTMLTLNALELAVATQDTQVIADAEMLRDWLIIALQSYTEDSSGVFKGQGHDVLQAGSGHSTFFVALATTVLLEFSRYEDENKMPLTSDYRLKREVERALDKVWNENYKPGNMEMAIVSQGELAFDLSGLFARPMAYLARITADPKWVNQVLALWTGAITNDRAYLGGAKQHQQLSWFFVAWCWLN